MRRDKADIAARVLMIIQRAVRVDVFSVNWHGGVGRPTPELANMMLTRRLWVHCLLENAWLSVNDLERITGRDHRTIEADRRVVAEWCAADKDFRDLVWLCEELVDASVTLIASRDRLFRVAVLASVEARRIRSAARLQTNAPRPALVDRSQERGASAPVRR